MDKFSDPDAFSHHGFLRHFLAVEKPDAYPPQLWLPIVNLLISELTDDERSLVRTRTDHLLTIPSSARRRIVTVEAKIRASERFAALSDALSAFEAAFFCVPENGQCTNCGTPEAVGGPLCNARLGGVPQTETVPDAMPEPETAQQPSDPLLDYFKIPFEPGEINGFEYDALIDSAPVVVWRASTEIETDFVEDILAEAVGARVARVFLVARTEIGPEKLPMNPNVALILLAIPRDFHIPEMNVIETDEIVFS